MRCVPVSRGGSGSVQDVRGTIAAHQMARTIRRTNRFGRHVRVLNFKPTPWIRRLVSIVSGSMRLAVRQRTHAGCIWQFTQLWQHWEAPPNFVNDVPQRIVKPPLGMISQLCRKHLHFAA